MIARLMKHNPSFLHDREIIERFCVRGVELEYILELLRENQVSEANQHLLVVGKRGSGKTMLVHRVVAEVRRDDSLNEFWHPVVFAEESYLVSTPGEFWLEALLHLADQAGDERLRLAYERLRTEADETRLHQTALSMLLDFADERQVRLLIIVENLDMLLGQQLDDDSGWTLRHTLQGEPRIMMLATAVHRFEQIEEHNMPLYGFFRPLDLPSLTGEECATLWRSITGNTLEPNKQRPVQILTGGNPRLVSILASFARGRSFRELMSELLELVDDHTNYFKSNVEALPVVERKVFLVLANLWQPSLASEVAQHARMNVSKVSSLLGRLADRGAVSVVGKQGRSKLYQVSERLFNIYHLLRHRGGAEQRVRAVFEFMQCFYEPPQMVGRLKEIIDEACHLESGDVDDHRNLFRSILAYLHKAQPQLALETLLMTPVDFLKRFEPALMNPEANPEAGSFESIGELQVALNKEPGNHRLWSALGRKLVEEDHKDEGVRALRMALDLGARDVNTRRQLARLTRDLEEQHNLLEELLEEVPENPDVWLDWSDYNAKTDNIVGFVDALLKAAELEGDSELRSMMWRTITIASLAAPLLTKEPSRIEAALRKNDSLMGDAALISYLMKRKKFDLMSDVVAKMLSRDMEHSEEAYALVYWSTAIFLREETYVPLEIHRMQSAFKPLVERHPESVSLKLLMRDTFVRLGDLAKALAANQKVLELDPGNTDALNSLLALRDARDDFVQLAERYLSLSNRSAHTLNHVAWIGAKSTARGQLETAALWSSEAVAAEPNRIDYLCTHAFIMARLQRRDGTLAAIQELLHCKDITQVPQPPFLLYRLQEVLSLSSAAGFTAEVLESIETSALQLRLEPLIVALKLRLGHEIRAPEEVVEIAQDVNRRIDRYIEKYALSSGAQHEEGDEEIGLVTSSELMTPIP